MQTQSNQHHINTTNPHISARSRTSARTPLDAGLNMRGHTRLLTVSFCRVSILLAGFLTAAVAFTSVGCANNKPKSDGLNIPETNRSEDLAKAQRFQEQAMAAQKAKDYDKAINLYGQALQIENGLGAAWHNAGICFMEQRKFTEARDAFLRAAETLPGDPRPYENLGILYLERLGHAQKAYDAFGYALARDQYSTTALRGSTSAIRALRLVSTEAQGRLRNGLDVEIDEAWRRIMTTERIRIEAGLRDQARQ